MSIRLKILLGCLCLTGLTIVVGLLAQTSQREIGDLATRLYDNSLLSTNALRSAQGTVMRLRIQLGADGAEAGNEPLSDALTERVGAALSSAEADMSVASSGSISDAGRALVDQTRRRLQRLSLSGTVLTQRMLKRELVLAEEEIDASVRVFAADAHEVKGEVGDTMDASVTRTNIAIGVAAGLMALVAWLLTHTIVPALRRAAAVAKSIADGNLANRIEAAGRDETGELLGALATMQSNIAQRFDRVENAAAKQAETFDAERAVQGDRLQTALESMVQGLCIFDSRARIVVINKRFGEIFQQAGIAPGAAMQKLAKLPELGAVLAMARRMPSFTHETADGRILAISKRKSADGSQTLTVDDVTSDRQAAERLEKATSHDPLTGLLNRAGLGADMQRAIAEAERAKRTALIVLDIDGFRAVNEAYGHQAGDGLLRLVAERLLQVVGGDDVVARIGGDDFAVLRTRRKPGEDVELLAGAILAAFEAPFPVEGRNIAVGVSIGIAPAKNALEAPGSVSSLLRRAELALGAARASGRNRFSFFEPSMEISANQRHQTEADLAEALANNELEVFYQPFVDVPMQSVAGFEALIRWRHPVRGMVPPSEFIPVAEESGAIGPIGLWVLETACRQAADWPMGLTLAVNLSPLQFKTDNLYADIAAILQRTGFEPYRLQLEVTEGVFLQNSEQVLWTLTALRKLGVRISMDDFGTGYSSLGYLSRFPFDKVKIDQSFVRDLMKRENLMIVRAIIGLSKAMGISVMAEGVETRRQMETLIAESCSEMQGYYFAMPMPFSDLPRFLMQFSTTGIAPEPAAAKSQGRGTA